MSDEQIKHMVDRFLGWRLPENFNPDAGISFKPNFNENTPWPMKHEPTGTNLLDATQAEAMIRYLVEGMPPQQPASTVPEGLEQQCRKFVLEHTSWNPTYENAKTFKALTEFVSSLVRAALAQSEGRVAKARLEEAELWNTKFGENETWDHEYHFVLHPQCPTCCSERLRALRLTAPGRKGEL